MGKQGQPGKLFLYAPGSRLLDRNHAGQRWETRVEAGRIVRYVSGLLLVTIVLLLLLILLRLLLTTEKHLLFRFAATEEAAQSLRVYVQRIIS